MTDEELWGVSAAALGFIRTYCGWHIAPVRTEVLYPRSVIGHLFTLPTLRLKALVGITSEGEPVDLADPYPVDWAEEGSVLWPGTWGTRLRTLAVQVQHGHDVPPPELVALGKRLESVMVGGVGNVRVGNISVSPVAVSAATGGLEPYMLTILDHYRLPPLS